MKVLRIFVSLCLALGLFVTANPARAEINGNFVKEFLSRYRPSTLPVSTAPATASSQDVASLIRTGQLPLTVPDLINLMLQNNLDIIVNRLSPLSSGYLSQTLFRPFEPSLTLSATVNRDTLPATSQFTGAPALSTLGGLYSVGFSQTLQTGTNVAVNFSVNRSSSNSVFSTFTPLYTGLLQYSFTQHLLKGFGRTNNTSQIRIAQNNQKISETQFEKQLMDLVAQAERSYWDLVFAGEDIKIKQRSMDLARRHSQIIRSRCELERWPPLILCKLNLIWQIDACSM